mgnify:CR=1 FL=1
MVFYVNVLGSGRAGVVVRDGNGGLIVTLYSYRRQPDSNDVSH